MDKLPFRARQMHPAIVVGVEPDGEQALRLVPVAVHIVALTSKGRANGETRARATTRCLDSLIGTYHRLSDTHHESKHRKPRPPSCEFRTYRARLAGSPDTILSICGLTE